MKVAFNSESTRLGKIQKIRRIGLPFFPVITFDRSSPFLNFSFSNAKILPLLTRTVLYEQPKTNTYVHMLYDHITNQSIVMKAYRIRNVYGHQGSSHIDPHDVEINYLRILSKFLVNHITPHITLPIGRSIIPHRDVSTLFAMDEDPPPDGAYQIILAEAGDASLGHRMSTISSMQLKVLIFQTVFTLAAIHTSIGSFRHNDLHIGNTLVQDIDAKNIKSKRSSICAMYEIGGKTFYHDVRACPYRIMIWDFYYSTINQPGFARNSKFSQNRDMSAPNLYFDMREFFDSIHCASQHHKKQNTQELEEFIDWVLPEHARYRYKKRRNKTAKKPQICRMDGPSALEVLDHPYFRSLQTRPSKSMVIIAKYNGDRNAFGIQEDNNTLKNNKEHISQESHHGISPQLSKPAADPEHDISNVRRNEDDAGTIRSKSQD
jgi:hypothetical protein